MSRGARRVATTWFCTLPELRQSSVGIEAKPSCRAQGSTGCGHETCRGTINRFRHCSRTKTSLKCRKRDYRSRCLLRKLSRASAILTLSPAELSRLKSSGVADGVILAMVEVPGTKDHRQSDAGDPPTQVVHFRDASDPAALKRARDTWRTSDRAGNVRGRKQRIRENSRPNRQSSNVPEVCLCRT